MADYCTKCSHLLFGESVEPDIDVEGEFAKLKTDKYIPVLCEGCGMIGIGNNAGELIIAYPTDREHPREEFEWITLKEYKENVEPGKLYDPVKKESIKA